MTKKIIISAFLFSLLPAQERMGEWESHTSPLDIRGMVEYENKILAATGGGLLIFDRTAEEFSTLTNIDGLVTTDLHTIAVDPYGNAWLGGSEPDGIIQIYNPGEQFSVAEFDYGFFEISGFTTGDSMVYAIFRENQDRGLVEFIYHEGSFIYRDIYRNWPSNINRIESVELFGDYIWVGSDHGLYYGNWRTDNLKDRNNWTVFAEGDVTSMCRTGNGDELLYVMDKVVYKLDTGDHTFNWQWNHFADTHFIFEDICTTPDGNTWGILRSSLIKLGDTAKEWQINTNYYLENLHPLSDNTVMIGTKMGFSKVDTTSYTIRRIIPNAPVTNQFTAVTVLDDGRVVAGSNRGLSIKEPQGWRNIVEHHMIESVHGEHDYSYFAADTLAIDFGGFIADLEQGPDGLLYCAIRGTKPVPNPNYNLRGGGIIIIDVDDPANYTLVDTSVLDYYRDEYMVVKDLEFDRRGNLWVADTYVTTKLLPLHVRNNSGDWGHFSATDSPVGLGADALAFDHWGRIWIGSLKLETQPSGVTNGGLAILSYDGSPESPENVEWASEFEGENIWSIDVNRNNNVFMLTPLGLSSLTIQNTMSNPVISQSRNYFPNISFGEGSRVKIDPRNNAWTVSPEQGVHVLLENATYWPTIDGFRFDNSYLLSDNTNDLEFDAKRGLAYIVSKRGLNILKIPFSDRTEMAGKLKIFPSPYKIPNSVPMVVDGLADNSSVKIMTVGGRVVRSIEQNQKAIQGYQAVWDGRDDEGKLVGSGVYLIMVYSESETVVGKVTVIRH